MYVFPVLVYVQFLSIGKQKSHQLNLLTLTLTATYIKHLSVNTCMDTFKCDHLGHKV